MTLLGAGVLALGHCTVIFHLSVNGDCNELVPLHGVTFPSAGLFGVLLAALDGEPDGLEPADWEILVSSSVL